MAVIKYKNESGEWVELSTIKGDAGKAPKVNPTTNTWLVWDDYKQEWVDSGVIAGIGNKEFEDSSYWVLNEVSQGKRKIAKALTQKYEPTTEYETFDDMANKIKTLPLRVDGEDNALQQNGGVLQFYDVYNEMVKAYRQFGGKGIYCCAVEISRYYLPFELPTAHAYYTSDGKYFTNGGTYTFESYDWGNHFIVFFYNSAVYDVPVSLPNEYVLNIYCLNGKPNIVLGSTSIYTRLNGIYVYTDERVDATSANCVINNSSITKAYLPHIVNVENSQPFYNSGRLMELEMPNLITASSNLITGTGLSIKYFPKLETVASLGQSSSRYILPSLLKFTNQYLIYGTITDIYLPSVQQTDFISSIQNAPTYNLIRLGKQKDAPDLRFCINSTNSYGRTNIKLITVEKGFQSNIDMGYCDALTRECIVDIFNNLADNKGEDTLIITISPVVDALLEDTDRAIAYGKNYSIAVKG